jgi:hypothetical protein
MSCKQHLEEMCAGNRVDEPFYNVHILNVQDILLNGQQACAARGRLLQGV